VSTPATPRPSGLRTAARVLLGAGLLLLACGGGYTVAYYLTSGFNDPGPAVLADLQYGNLAAGAGGLCCGGVLAVVGTILLIVAGRRP
jgi:hypothetical protein